MLEQVLTALKSIRAPVATDEYDLHQLACQALAQAGIGCVHEAQLAPRCRIDVLCGRVGIEIKRGRPTASALTRQLTRYAQSGALDALVVLSEQSVSLPEQITGVPVRLVCLYKLWGLSDASGGMEHPQDETLIKAGVAMRLAPGRAGAAQARKQRLSGCGRAGVFTGCAACRALLRHAFL